MIEHVLPFTAAASVIEMLLMLFGLGITIFLVVALVGYILRSNKERRRLRLEVGKLADELERIRKQVKDAEKGNPSSASK